MHYLSVKLGKERLLLHYESLENMTTQCIVGNVKEDNMIYETSCDVVICALVSSLIGYVLHIFV